MTAIGQNFEMFQGDTKRLRVSVTDDNNVAFPLTNCTINWVTYKQTSKQVVLQKTTGGGGITVEDESGGIIVILLEPEDTETLLGQFTHEGELTDGTGTISTIFIGSVKILNSEA